MTEEQKRITDEEFEEAMGVFSDTPRWADYEAVRNYVTQLRAELAALKEREKLATLSAWIASPGRDTKSGELLDAHEQWWAERQKEGKE